MIRVVIPEGIPSLNKGEAAILEGYHVMLSLCGPHEITLFSPDAWIQDDSMNYAHLAKVVGGINLYYQGDSRRERSRLRSYGTVSRLFACAVLSRLLGRRAKHLFKDELLTALLDADIILGGHDGRMDPGQFHIVRAGRIMGKPVVMYGGGKDSGPPVESSSRKKRQMTYAVAHSIACVVRDKGTYEYLRSCQVDEKYIRLAPDPAVLLPPCESAKVNDILSREGVPTAMRKNLCAVIVAEGGIVARESFRAEGDSDVKRTLRVGFWRELLSYLVDTTDVYVVFLPHCIGPSPRNDDRRMAKDIYDALICDKSRIKCVEQEYSAGELKGIMKSCQLVLSERAHAAIGAFSAGTPCVGFAVSGDRRMHNIVNGMFARPVHDLDAPDTSQLKKLTVDEWNNRQQTAAAMAGHVGRIVEQACETAEWVHGRIEESLRRRS
jgi:polysaccharide pyruvyl transferase WcaK-like protein